MVMIMLLVVTTMLFDVLSQSEKIVLLIPSVERLYAQLPMNKFSLCERRYMGE